MPTTPNHGWVTPTVGASADTWGGLLNAVVDDQDALLSGGQNTILGRITSGTGPMIALTAAQATSALVAFAGDTGTGGLKGLVPAPAAGDAAARKVLTAAGTWSATDIKALGRFVGSTGATVTARGISMSRGSTGSYTVTLSPAMPDVNYLVEVETEDGGLSNFEPSVTSKTTSGFVVSTYHNLPTFGPYDPSFLNIVIITV